MVPPFTNSPYGLRATEGKMNPRGAHTVDVDPRASNLKAKSLRGGIVTMGFQAIDAVIRIGSIAILARVLMPADFGLVSMVTALTAIAEQFKDIGLSTATVQKKTISHEQLSKLFWINVITGVAIAAFISAVSVPLAEFFRDTRLVYITIAIASGFVWSGAAIQHQALLRRHMKYTAIGAIQIGSTIISTGIATVLAFKGYGYWALVWREVFRNVFIAIGTWLLCPWRPGFPHKRTDVDDLLTFGGHLTAFNMIVFLMASVDQVLIGKVYGAALLGIYRQAHQLVVWPVMQLTVPLSRVAEPTLSFLQDSPERYRQAYQRLVTIVSFVMMPLLLFAAIYSREIVLLLLGENWIDAAPIFRILALAMFIRPASDSTGLLLVTCGRTRRYLNLGVATGLILLVAFSIGVIWGPLGVAYGALVATYAVLALRLRYGLEGTPVNVRAFCRATKAPLVASAAMAVLLLVMNSFLRTSDPLAVLALAMPVSLGTYVLAWIVIPGGKATLSELANDFGVSLRFEHPSAPLMAAFWKRALWWHQ